MALLALTHPFSLARNTPAGGSPSPEPQAQGKGKGLRRRRSASTLAAGGGAVYPTPP